jgi:hypothetical protein
MNSSTIEALESGGDDQQFDPVEELITACRQPPGDIRAIGRYRLPPKPYPGLKSFGPAYASLFFGREGQERMLAARLERANLLAVLGGSGSGKSSLVRAGLLPYLRSVGKISNRPGRWYVVETRPGTDPTRAIVEALWLQLCEPLLEQKYDSGALQTALAGLPTAQTSEEKVRDATLLSDLPALLKSPSSHPSERDRYLRTLIQLLVTPGGDLRPEGLFTFANETVQIIDDRVSRGVQAGPANLLLLIDQFEELFRPEVHGSGRDAVFSLLRLVQERGRRQPRPGLFLTITMRSEELHRCAEHEGLSGVILDSSIQLDLISSDADVKAAVVEPAVRVFDSWGVPCRESDSNRTAPFDALLVDGLREQAAFLRESLDHKPDSLPLLQHALQSTWNNAVARWSREKRQHPDFSPAVTCEDFEHWSAISPLRACLDAGANKALDKALEALLRKGAETQLSESAARDLIDVAFISLARLDDSNRWVRHFASPEQIARASGLTGPGLDERSKAELVKIALDIFNLAGYLSFRNGKYDVSHESFIRSWRHYQKILDDAQATRKALIDFDETLDVRETDSRIEDRAVAHDFPLFRPARAAGRLIRAMWKIPLIVRIFGPTIAFGKALAGQHWKEAWDLVPRGQFKTRRQILAPSRRFSDSWLRAQLIDNWDRKARLQTAAGVAHAPVPQPADAEKRAEQRWSQFTQLLTSAGHWQRVGRFRVPVTIILLILAPVYMYVASAKSVAEMVTAINMNSVTQLLAEPAPPTSDSSIRDINLHQALVRVQTADGKVFNEAGTLLERSIQSLYDGITLVVDSAVRGALLFAIPQVSSPDLLDAKTDFKPANCVIKGKDHDGIELKLWNGTRRGLNKDWKFVFGIDGSESRPVSNPLTDLAEGGIACLGEDAQLLLIWNPKDIPWIAPISWINKGSGDFAASHRKLPPVSPTNVDSNFVFAVQDEVANSANVMRRIQSFHKGDVRGYRIELKKDLVYYVSAPFGVAYPEPVPRGARVFGPCRPAEEDTCRVEELRFGGGTRDFTFQRSNQRQGNVQSETALCRKDNDKLGCILQEITLYPTRQEGRGEPFVRFRLSEHLSAEINGAAIEGDYLFVSDKAGGVWRYVLGWAQVRELIRKADLSGKLEEFANKRLDPVLDTLSPTCKRLECYKWSDTSGQ